MKKNNTENLLQIVKDFIAERERFLKALKGHETPAYLFDTKRLQTQLGMFKEVFTRAIPDIRPYYAMKANPYVGVLTEAVNYGYGVDVSSGRELEKALEAKAMHMLFTGPGKTDQELRLFLRHTDKVVLNIDNFSEFDRLIALVPRGNTVRAGIRIYTSHHGNWSKFGIPLARLAEFWQSAQKYPFIHMQGIQVHMSWNESAKPYELVLKELSGYLRSNFTSSMRKQIEFIDFGGGFVPHRMNGYYVDKSGNEVSYLTNSDHNPLGYKIQESIPLDRYAQQIGAAIDTYLRPLLDCKYYCEPGRIITTPSMHIALKVVDVKENGVILDGGNNIVGWERMEEEYHPLINLTHPSELEIPIMIYGSLCTPHDIWGYYCYAESIESGDVILVPNQGAYAYTLAQNFIKPIPTVLFA